MTIHSVKSNLVVPSVRSDCERHPLGAWQIQVGALIGGKRCVTIRRGDARGAYSWPFVYRNVTKSSLARLRRVYKMVSDCAADDDGYYFSNRWTGGETRFGCRGVLGAVEYSSIQYWGCKRRGLDADDAERVTALRRVIKANQRAVIHYGQSADTYPLGHEAD